MNPLPVESKTPLDSIYTENAERALWLAALLLFIDDAVYYVKGNSEDQKRRRESEEAYSDLTSDGPILAHLCEMSECNASWVKRCFIQKMNE